jgi:hypothetical protein
MNDAETVEQKTRRRRWLTLAEFVAVAGVLIGGLGLYLNWADRREERAAQAATAAKEAKVSRVVRLEGTIAGDGDAITLSDPARKIETIDIAFPPRLGVAAREGVPQPRIEKDWFKDALLKATDGGADDVEGRLPVLITAYWWDADVKRSDRAIYDVVWRTEGQTFSGRSLDLTALSLRERGGSSARLDRLWVLPAKE